MSAGPEGLAAQVLTGDVRAASRLMRALEDEWPRAEGELRRLYSHTGRARVIGVTGSPGAGKSTLTSRLISHLRGLGKTVGVLAVDPSSPFSGGALLGDRIRMQEHAVDPGVFIRSMATRGHLGGLTRATAGCLHVMDALGRDVVIVETVGVGQDEIEVARLAQSTAVVLVPGLGDDVQAIKAGLLEVADVFVVNKSDLPGADRLVRELRQMFEIRHATKPMRNHPPVGSPTMHPEPLEWEPPIVKTVATSGEGAGELWDALESHRAFLASSGGLPARERARALAHLLDLLRGRLLREAMERIEYERGTLDEVAAKLVARELDPYALVEELVASHRGGHDGKANS